MARKAIDAMKKSGLHKEEAELKKMRKERAKRRKQRAKDEAQVIGQKEYRYTRFSLITACSHVDRGSNEA